MEKRNRLHKTASDANTVWFDRIFKIKALAVPDIPIIDGFEEFRCSIASSFQTFRTAIAQQPYHDEKYVQTAFQPFFSEIRYKYFTECRELFKVRKLETDIVDFLDVDYIIKSCFITGLTDGSIVWNNFGVLTTELKNKNMNLTVGIEGPSVDLKCALAQLGTYMRAEIDNIYSSLKILPDKVYGILTNGIHWTLLVAIPTIVNNDLNIDFSFAPIIVLSDETSDVVLRLVHLSVVQSRTVLDLVRDTCIGNDMSKLSIKGRDPEPDERGSRSNSNSAISRNKGSSASNSARSKSNTKAKSTHSTSNSQSARNNNNNNNTKENSASAKIYKSGDITRKALTTLSLSAHNNIPYRGQLDFMKKFAVQKGFCVTAEEIFENPDI